MEIPESDDRLNSWKEIAAFLGRTVRTVQRWEKHDGLPLRRGGPGKRGAVTASKRELSAWWERRRDKLDDDEPVLPARPDQRQTPWLAIGAATALVILGVIVAIGVARIPRTLALNDAARLPPAGRLFAGSTTEGRTPTFIPIDSVPIGLALSSSADRAYVALKDEKAVAVLDLTTRKVIDRLDSVELWSRMFWSADGSGPRLFTVGETEIGAYDLSRRTLKKFSAGGGTIRDAYLSRDGRHLWLALAQAGLRVLDVDTGRLDTIPTVGCPMYFAAAPQVNRLFVSYQCSGPSGRLGHDAIEIYDEVSRRRIVTRAGPPLVGSYLDVSPDGMHLWIDTANACSGDEYDQVDCPPGTGPVLHVLRTDSLERLLTVRVPDETFGAVPHFFRDGTRLLLEKRGLTVIERANGVATETIEISPRPGQFTADGRAFIAVDDKRRGVFVFEMTDTPTSAVPGAAASHWSGDGTGNDIAGGTHALNPEELQFGPGVFGQAFRFNADSRGVEFGRRLEGDIAGGQASYTAWINPERTGTPMHILSRAGSDGWRWWMTGDGKLSFCFLATTQLSCDGDVLSGPATTELNHWSHVAVVRTESGLALFYDGREIAARSLAGFANPPIPDVTQSALRLGTGVNGQAPFQGRIDEVVLFRRGLSVADLAELRRATSLDPR